MQMVHSKCRCVRRPSVHLHVTDTKDYYYQDAQQMLQIIIAWKENRS